MNNVKFDTEMAKALEMIRIESLLEALKEHAKETIGIHDKSFGEEVAEAYKLCGKCYISDGVNYYSRRAMSYVEISEGERIIASKNAYLKAVNKILFLNTFTKVFCGKSFILKRVNSKNFDSIVNLVDAFEMCIRYTLLSEGPY